METQPKAKRRVPPGSPLFPDKPRLSKEEIARRKAESHAFGERCRAIFNQVAPQLMADHYGWSIHIEPDSGNYFIEPDPEVAFQKAKQKHPTAILMEMCLNETGVCGRIYTQHGNKLKNFSKFIFYLCVPLCTSVCSVLRFFIFKLCPRAVCIDRSM